MLTLYLDQEHDVQLFLKLCNWQQGVSRDKYQEIKGIIADHFGISIPSLRCKLEYLQKRTKIRPYWIDCCIKGCMAYTGDDKTSDRCPFAQCREPRYKPQSTNPRRRYLYIPLISRLMLQFNDPIRAQTLKQYRDDLLRTHEDGELRDFGDGDLFNHFHRRSLGLFRDPHDVALHLSLDGVQLTQGKTHEV